MRVLGAVAYERDGAEHAIASEKQRLLLATIAAAGPATRAQLIDSLWDDDPPDTAEATLLGYISRLRACLGKNAIVRRGSSYALGDVTTDAGRFEALIDDDADASTLELALTLWTGSAYGDLAHHPMIARAAERLERHRNDVRVRLAAIHLANGDTARPVSMLESVVADAPTREDAWVLLVRSLVAAGRPADAVRAANRARRQLAEVGLEPSAELREAERSALQERSPAPQALEPTPIRYARNGGIHLAYQVVGGGPVDVVLSSYQSVSIDSIWDDERFTEFVSRLAARWRVVLYDTRGIGLSDPIDTKAPPSLETQADDLEVVLAASGANRPVLVGVGDGGPTAITYAHRHPDTSSGLVLINTFARMIEAPDYTIGIARYSFEANITLSTDPGSDRDTSLVLRNHAPSVAGDSQFRRWWERAGRRGASPSTAVALWKVRFGADVRSLLPEIRVPTLVLHRHRSRIVPIRFGRYLADNIPGAHLVHIDGADQSPFTEGADAITDAISEFVDSLVR